jgi:cystathionine gamma-synthase
LDFETRAIHAGQQPDPATGAVIVPIYQTSTYVQEGVGVHKGYDYSRTANPTRRALEECLASLEGAQHGLAFSSGMGAITTVLHLLSPGDRVMSVNDVYGGTYRIFRKVYEPKGYRFEFAPAETFNEPPPGLVDSGTRLVWIESPTNPLLNVVDIEAVAAAAHAAGALCVVDNTFATPFLQRPLELGADVVVHSTTKYLGGHSDVIGGFVGVSDDGLADRLAFLQNSLGAVPGPFDSWLVLRGLKTLALRMRQHCANAYRIAAWLSDHDAVRRVRYPGLAVHPQHALARRQMDDFGGMVSFEVEGDERDARAVAEATRIWRLGESLGGVESLIEHPGLMTHATLAGTPFEVPDNLIRLSVGIESADDLIADLEQALARIGQRVPSA